METFYSFAFMVFCFGFFLFVIQIMRNDRREEHERRLDEKKEFNREPKAPQSDQPPS